MMDKIGVFVLLLFLMFGCIHISRKTQSLHKNTSDNTTNSPLVKGFYKTRNVPIHISTDETLIIRVYLSDPSLKHQLVLKGISKQEVPLIDQINIPVDKKNIWVKAKNFTGDEKKLKIPVADEKISFSLSVAE